MHTLILHPVGHQRFEYAGIPIRRKSGDRHGYPLEESTRAAINARLPEPVVTSRWRFKQCGGCRTPFLGDLTRRFCSPGCQRDAGRRACIRFQSGRDKAIPPDACHRCGGPVNAIRASRRFCSNACRQATHRAAKLLDPIKPPVASHLPGRNAVGGSAP